MKNGSVTKVYNAYQDARTSKISNERKTPSFPLSHNRQSFYSRIHCATFHIEH